MEHNLFINQGVLKWTNTVQELCTKNVNIYFNSYQSPESPVTQTITASVDLSVEHLNFSNAAIPILTIVLYRTCRWKKGRFSFCKFQLEKTPAKNVF